MGGHEWKEPRKAKREQGGKLREQRELGDKGVEHKGMEKRTPVVAKETDNSYSDKILQGTFYYCYCNFLHYLWIKSIGNMF